MSHTRILSFEYFDDLNPRKGSSGPQGGGFQGRSEDGPKNSFHIRVRFYGDS